MNMYNKTVLSTERSVGENQRGVEMTKKERIAMVVAVLYSLLPIAAISNRDGKALFVLAIPILLGFKV